MLPWRDQFHMTFGIYVCWVSGCLDPESTVAVWLKTRRLSFFHISCLALRHKISHFHKFMSTSESLGVIALCGHWTEAFSDFYHLKNLMTIWTTYWLFGELIDWKTYIISLTSSGGRGPSSKPRWNLWRQWWCQCIKNISALIKCM